MIQTKNTDTKITRTTSLNTNSNLNFSDPISFGRIREQQQDYIGQKMQVGVKVKHCYGSATIEQW